MDSNGSKEPCIRWGHASPRGKGVILGGAPAMRPFVKNSFYHLFCHVPACKQTLDTKLIRLMVSQMRHVVQLQLFMKADIDLPLLIAFVVFFTEHSLILRATSQFTDPITIISVYRKKLGCKFGGRRKLSTSKKLGNLLWLV